MVDLTSTASPDFVTTHAVAVSRPEERSPSAKEVVNALLQEEKVAKQQRLTYPLEPLGHWRLCFYRSSPF